MAKTKKATRAVRRSKKQESIIAFALRMWKERRSLVVGIFAVVFVTALSLLGQSNWYKSSLLEVSYPFDGTVYPMEKSPNYLTWKGNVKTDRFDTVPAKDLIDLPDYTLSLQDGDSDEIKNAKLTYPVAYLGSYEWDHQEGVGSHLAVDIRVPVGTPVRAIAHGTVTKVDRRSSGFGNHMCIRHKGVPDPDDTTKTTTLYSCYNHMDTISVEEGSFVFKGDTVGTSGNTGTSTTPHLHFQVDREDAPWYPYWPFTSAEAASANLSFFDAVSVGLNKEKAKELTVNPMRLVSENYNETGMHGNLLVASTDNSVVTDAKNATTTEDVAEPVMTSFEIIADKDTFTTSEDAVLIIAAKDQNGETFSDYKASTEFSVSSDSSSADFKKVINFVKGKSRLVVSNEVAESFEIKIQDGSAQGTILLIATDTTNVADTETTESSLEEDEELHAVAGNEEIEDTQSVQEQVISDVIFSGESALLTGNTMTFYVELKDEAGATITNLSENINITLDGKGTLTPTSLNSSSISSGKAELRYTSSEEETAKVTIEGKSYEIQVVAAVKPAIAFSVRSTDNTLYLGEDTTITIQAIDEDGKDVPSYFAAGVVELSFDQGAGEITPTQLSVNDFNSGKAEVKVRGTTEGNVKIRAHNGAFVGVGNFQVKEKQNVFTDVSNDHKNAAAIRYLKENEIIGGYADGSFKPDNEVSRIEAVKMLILALNKGLDPSQQLEFPDTDNAQWYAPYVGRALYLKMVKGYPDGTFKPANKVNRAEYYTILIRAAIENVAAATDAPFDDVPMGTWFTDYVAYAKNNNITDAQGKFFPSDNVTRAEVAETLYRILNR